MLATAAKPGVWFPVLDECQCSRAFADAVVAGRFEFAGEAFELGPNIDFLRNPSADIEWSILLHKFYFAPGLGRAWRETGEARYLFAFTRLVRQWVDQVPLDFLPSDVAGRRIQNWISAWHYFESAPLIDAGFRRVFRESLVEQVLWLLDHLTPARNHRTLELLAVLLAGVALRGTVEAAPSWIEFAAGALAANLDSDFRADGVHIEQSTDYHHIVLRNALIAQRLAVLNGIAMPREFDAAIRRALEFALFVHRPDGRIPSLSDGDTGSFTELLQQGYELHGDERFLWAASRGRLGRAPEQTGTAFPHGGYYILRSGWGELGRYEDERYLVFDCGPLGEGNHGHFDLLSFELYGYGQPLIVDPGRFTYSEAGAENRRVLFRGTRYHNTVTVDGRNQTRYEFHKKKFKVRGPEPEFALRRFEAGDAGGGVVRGRAASYEYDVVHEREIRMSPDGRRVVVIDDLTSPSEHTYEQVFHLSAAAEGQVRQLPGGGCAAPNLRITPQMGATAATAARVELGWVSETYGVRCPAPIVVFSTAGRDCRFETLIEVLP